MAQVSAVGLWCSCPQAWQARAGQQHWRGPCAACCHVFVPPRRSRQLSDTGPARGAPRPRSSIRMPATHRGESVGVPLRLRREALGSSGDQPTSLAMSTRTWRCSSQPLLLLRVRCRDCRLSVAASPPPGWCMAIRIRATCGGIRSMVVLKLAPRTVYPLDCFGPHAHRVCGWVLFMGRAPSCAADVVVSVSLPAMGSLLRCPGRRRIGKAGVLGRRDRTHDAGDT